MSISMPPIHELSLIEAYCSCETHQLYLKTGLLCDVNAQEKSRLMLKIRLNTDLKTSIKALAYLRSEATAFRS